MIKFKLISAFILLITMTLFADYKIDLQDFLEKIQWYGQAAFRIPMEERSVYIDPLNLPEDAPKAAMIFITHGHGDHLSKKDIQQIADENTTLIAPSSCVEQIKELGLSHFHLVNPGDSLEIDGIEFIAVPAYNVKKTQFHPKKNNWVGYILNIDGIKIYHAGDTERIPEMKNFQCDIAFLPLGQTYTMNSVEEAVEAAEDINPKIAVPMHYGLYEGTEKDAITFKKLLEGKIQVVIKNPAL